MAFGEKYRGETYTNNGGHYYIKIYQDGWTGSTTNIDIAANGLILDYPASSDIFEPIRGSSLTIKAISPTDFFWEDFFDTNFGDFKVELYNITSAAIEWEGFNTPEIYSEPFEVFPYPVTLRFVDGLAQLKNVEFPSPSGLKHVIQVLRLCLNQINDLNINDCYNVFENSHTATAGNSALVQTYVDSSIYRDVIDGEVRPLTCYDVLNIVLRAFACFITQVDGEWYIVRSATLQNGTLPYKKFLPAVGAESGTTVDSYGNKSTAISVVESANFTYGTTEARHVNGSGTLTIDEKIKRIEYIYHPFKFGSSSLIINPYFNIGSKWDNTLQTTGGDWIDPTTQLPYFWSQNAMTYGSDQDFTTENEAIIFWNLDVGASSLYIYQSVTDAFVSTSDKINISLVGIYNDGNSQSGSVNAFCSVKLTNPATSDIYYLTIVDNVLVWQLTTTEKKLSRNFVRGTQITWTYADDQLVVYPFSGKANITVRFYKPTTTGTNTRFRLDTFDVKYLSAEVDAVDFSYIEEFEQTSKTYTWEVWHGEGVNFSSKGAMRDSTGNLLTEWGAGLDSIHEVVVDDLLASKSAYNKMLSLDLEGIITPLSRVKFEFNLPSGLTNTYFSPIGISRDIMTDFHVIELQEVKSALWISVQTYINNILNSTYLQPIIDPEPVKTKTTITPGTTTNTDGNTTNYFA